MKKKEKSSHKEKKEHKKRRSIREALKKYKKPDHFFTGIHLPEPIIEYDDLPDPLKEKVTGYFTIAVGAVIAGVLALIFTGSFGILATCLLFALVFYLGSRYFERLYRSDRLIYLDATVDYENENALSFFSGAKIVYIYDDEDERYSFMVKNVSRIHDKKNQHYYHGDRVRLYLDKAIVPRIHDGYIPDYFSVTVLETNRYRNPDVEEEEETEDEK